ncbi:AAA domain-containing protein [Mycoplasma iguanae]|uniref:AAA domain-containing protein n=1 Tax=Mycoplasma iguanae TaxID=292461 RepID=A0ABY5RBK4_9MOLU|nr:AAA domain-containing protein [Mycoplasma iguanae]UVD81990.1 AAA domain-containing protein [Mycoplasma iguanae]
MSLFETSSSQDKKNISSKNFNKYKKILNNLLYFTQSDNAVHTKIKGINIDLSKILSKRDLEKIFTKSEFKIKITQNPLETLLENLEKVGNETELAEFLDDNLLTFSNRLKKEAKKDLLAAKEEIKNRIIKDKNIFLKRWKTNILSVKNIYDELGIWPLFVSSFFVQHNSSKTFFYAPLLFKEVEILIEDNLVYLVSKNSALILNDKISFLAHEHFSLDIPKIKSIENISFSEAIDELLIETNEYFQKLTPNINFMSEFISMNMKSDLPKTDEIIIYPGIVLNSAMPSGGKLREAVIDLIKEDQIENLVNIDLLKDYSDDANQKVLNLNPLTRIIPTDISQEAAILAAMDHSSIIIGPPGTGKSQTIANILANILARKQTGLFISQKKVALDVVLKRMFDLETLMLPFSNIQKGNKKDKEKFYSIIQQRIQQIKLNKEFLDKPIYGQPFLNSIEVEYSKTKLNVNQNFDEDGYNAFTQLLKLYNAKIGQKFQNSVFNDDVKTIYKLLATFDSKEKFFEYWNDKNISKIELARKLEKVRLEIKFLKLAFYEKSFKKKWKIIEQIKTINAFSSFKKQDFELLYQIDEEQYDTYFQYYLHDTYYSLWWEKGKKIDNVQKNDIKQIIETISAISKAKVEDKLATDKEYKKTFKSFVGRAERAFTNPQIFIKLFSDILKDLFPIIVGTPEQLAPYIDFKNDAFDFVIFDEASQLFFEKAIPYISICQNVIVAGDDKQMQPSNWFGSRFQEDDEKNEINEIESLLDWAKLQSIPKYNLEMNYRSANSELVLFSSKNFYEENLKALDHVQKIQTNSIEVIEANGKWEQSINEIEADKIIEVANENIDKYNSIILLIFNSKQQQLIMEKILSNHPKLENAIYEDRLSVKNIENIQGDEAELVIISVCYDKTTKLNSVYVMTKSGRFALNVAITRAKSKMIVIKSINSKEIILNENNLNLGVFKNWLEYLEMESKKRKTYAIIQKANAVKASKRNLEKQIFKWMQIQDFANNIDIEANYPIGSYDLDLVLFEKNTKKIILAIELDLFISHNRINQLIEDRKKQDFLIAKGYPLYRITENTWFLSKNQIIKDIEKKLSFTKYN